MLKYQNVLKMENINIKSNIDYNPDHLINDDKNIKPNIDLQLIEIINKDKKLECILNENIYCNSLKLIKI